MAYGIGILAGISRRTDVPPGVVATPAATGLVSGWSRRDLSLVLALAGMAYLLAGQVELSEWFADWALGQEHWQADELPFTLIVLCAGLLWYGWRRDRETAAALRRNRELAGHLRQVQEAERRRLAARRVGPALRTRTRSHALARAWAFARGLRHSAAFEPQDGGQLPDQDPGTRVA